MPKAVKAIGFLIKDSESVALTATLPAAVREVKVIAAWVLFVRFTVTLT
jgi:hypothetical protein